MYKRSFYLRPHWCIHPAAGHVKSVRGMRDRSITRTELLPKMSLDEILGITVGSFFLFFFFIYIYYAGETAVDAWSANNKLKTVWCEGPWIRGVPWIDIRAV